MAKRSPESAPRAPEDHAQDDGRGGGWSLFKKRGGDLAQKLAVSVKEVARSALLKQGLDARERGNLPAAFHLLREAHDELPDDREVATVFWDVALEYGRPEQAAGAVSMLIRTHAGAKDVELAAQYWLELVSAVPDAMVEAPALVRIVPLLEAQMQAEAGKPSQAERRVALMRALEAVVHPENRGMSPGLAVRTAELARPHHPDVALRAARLALESEELHEAKRIKLVALVGELDPTADAEGPGKPRAEVRPESPEPILPASPGAAGCDAVSATVADTPSGADPSDPAPPDPTEHVPDSDANPASRHPLHEACAGPAGLSDDEVSALQSRLPPSTKVMVPDRSTPAMEAETAAPGEPGLTARVDATDAAGMREDQPALEIDPLGESFPELEVDPEPAPDPDVQSETGPQPDSGVDAQPESRDERELEVVALYGSEVGVDISAELVEEPPIAPSEPPGTQILGEPEDLLVPLVAKTRIDTPAQVVAFDVPELCTNHLSRFADAKIVEASLVGLDDAGVVVSAGDGRQSIVDYDRIEAVAAARTGGGELLVDLLLNWKSAVACDPLRSVRLVSTAADGALLAALAELPSRCDAVLLSGTEETGYGILPRYEGRGAYEREQLSLAR